MHVTSVDRVTGDEECTICITVVNYVESLLEENSTEADIEKALEKVCNFLPEAIKREVILFFFIFFTLPN